MLAPQHGHRALLQANPDLTRQVHDLTQKVHELTERLCHATG